MWLSSRTYHLRRFKTLDAAAFFDLEPCVPCVPGSHDLLRGTMIFSRTIFAMYLLATLVPETCIRAILLAEASKQADASNAVASCAENSCLNQEDSDF